jgi:hypothetical protein
MQKVSFKEKGANILMMEGRKVRGYISPTVLGFAYCIGKPSDTSVSMFTSNAAPFTIDEAKQRLLYAFNFGPENIRPCSENLTYITAKATEIFESSRDHWEQRFKNAKHYQKAATVDLAIQTVSEYIRRTDEEAKAWVKASAMFARYLKETGEDELSEKILSEIHDLPF